MSPGQKGGTDRDTPLYRGVPCPPVLRPPHKSLFELNRNGYIFIMRIIIDSREQTPLNFAEYDCSTEVGTLQSGDYSLAGCQHLVAVERKSVPDLVASVTRERDRFERELHRARGMDAFAVVVEGSLDDIRFKRYRSKASPHAVLQSCLAFGVRYKSLFLWAGSLDGAAYYTYHFLEKWMVEQRRHMRKLVEAGACL